MGKNEQNLEVNETSDELKPLLKQYYLKPIKLSAFQRRLVKEWVELGDKNGTYDLHYRCPFMSIARDYTTEEQHLRWRKRYCDGVCDKILHKNNVHLPQKGPCHVCPCSQLGAHNMHELARGMVKGYGQGFTGGKKNAKRV